MDTIKKLFITLAAVLLISLGFNNVAYATELTNLENTEYVEEALAINDISKDSGTQDQVDIPDNGGTQDQVDIPDDGDAQEEAGISEEDIEGDTEDLFNPEEYEIYIDEQGQVFYLEKEPVEPVIDDSDEIIQDKEAKQEDERKQEEEKKQEADKKEKKPAYTEKELRLLASLVYCEAGNQSYEGMLAVANVVLNRAKSDVYYHVSTIKEVIYDKQWAVQFSVTIKSKKTGKSMLDKALEAYDTGEFKGKNPAAEKKAMNRAIKAARAALEGENNIGNYMCFRMNNSGAKSIKKKYSDYRILGDHIFYRTK